MKAYLVSQPGSPNVLEPQNLPDPIPEKGKALIKIKAFGLNRAEAVTRMGGSFDAVKFPKVIGIECVGEVMECPGGELNPGQKVAAAMGGMGRKYNGSYAEMIVVPLANVFPIETDLDWITLASIPETYFTAWGCCFESLCLEKHPKIVIRPGASALGIAITQIVNHLGGQVIGVTRSSHKVEKMMKTGMYKVITSSSKVGDEVLETWSNGATGVVDTIVSEESVKDDLSMLAKGGRICLAGSLADSYGTSKSADFKDVLSLPNTSFFSSEGLHSSKDTQNLQTIIDRVEKGFYKPYIDAVFDFEDMVIAHQKMDRNEFTGKVVIKINS